MAGKRRPKKSAVEDVDQDVEYFMADLEEDERIERALELAEISNRILTMEAKRTAKLKEFNTRIRTDKERQKELIEAVATGKERRPKQMELIDGGG